MKKETLFFVWALLVGCNIGYAFSGEKNMSYSVEDSLTMGSQRTWIYYDSTVIDSLNYCDTYPRTRHTFLADHTYRYDTGEGRILPDGSLCKERLSFTGVWEYFSDTEGDKLRLTPTTVNGESIENVIPVELIVISISSDGLVLDVHISETETKRFYLEALY